MKKRGRKPFSDEVKKAIGRIYDRHKNWSVRDIEKQFPKLYPTLQKPNRNFIATCLRETIRPNEERINNSFAEKRVNLASFTKEYPQNSNAETIDKILDTLEQTNKRKIKLGDEPIVFSNRLCKWIGRLHATVNRIYKRIPQQEKESFEYDEYGALLYICSKYSWYERLCQLTGTEEAMDTSKLDIRLSEIKDIDSWIAFVNEWNESYYLPESVQIDLITNEENKKDGELK